MKLHQINRIIVPTAISLCAGLLLLFILGQTAHASPTAIFTVDTVLDQVDDNIGDGQCHTATGTCSLRAAVLEANAGSGDVIDMPSGVFTLTLTSEGELVMQKNITLNGNSTRATIIQGNPAGWNHRILSTGNNAKITLNNVTLRYGHAANFGGGIYVGHGSLTLRNSMVVSNTADGGGGGIYNSDQLTVTLSTIKSNSSIVGLDPTGGGVYNADGSSAYLTSTLIESNTSWGAAGFYNDSNARADLNFSTISSNHAITGGGGGFYNFGIADLTFVTVTNNLAADVGGGIYNASAATVILTNPFIAYNTASAGGGIYNDTPGNMVMQGGSVLSNTINGTGGGGGVYATVGTKLTISNAQISYNQAPSLTGDGGGIYSSSPLIIDASTLSYNGGHHGGGIYSAGGLTLTFSTLANNSAVAGGGLNMLDGGGLIESSTFRGNTAQAEGGGISLNGVFSDVVTIDDSTLSGNIVSNGPGGGLINFNIHLNMTNDTLSGNQATGGGGGIANYAGFPRLNNVTIADNIGGGGFYNDPTKRAAYFYNTVIAGNVDTGGTPYDCQGELTSGDYNLIQSTQNCTITGTTTHNITGMNPLLRPLQDNGGPTWTRALLPGSPAIDAGTPFSGTNLCATKDQRGVVPLIGPQCDIGAYEAPIFKHVYLPVILR